MSLDYIITSPLLISGISTSELKLNSGGNSINVITPSGLSNTYNFVLPASNGVQDQVLGLNSSLETEWINNPNSSNIFFDFVEDTTVFTSTSTSYLLIPSMTLTPPAGDYFCIFNATATGNVEYALFVGGVIINETIRDNPASSSKESFDTLFVVTVNGSESIEVRAKISSSGIGSSFDINERILFINEVL